MDQDALGIEVDLGPGHIVLDGDPVPLPKKGQSPPPIFGQFLLWPNVCAVCINYQDTIWYGGNLGPGYDVFNGVAAPPPKRGTTPSFRPMSVVAKGLE